MVKRLFIVHGWDGFPGNAWFPWLKKEAEAKDFEVVVPAMPNPSEPKIEKWVSFLKEKVEEVDEDTYFIGHSIGCQTILRYLETLDKKVGGVILVGGFVHLKPDSFENKEEKNIAKPWEETPINWNKIKDNKFICIFSDNDEFVPVEDSEIFKEKLNAKIIVEHEKGHFDDEARIKELPSVLDSLLEISK